jgi:hypothetical protein
LGALDQRLRGGLQAERDPGRHGVTKARALATQVTGERPAQLDGFQGPGAHLERGFGHRVAADVGGEPGVDVGRAIDRVAQQPRREPFAEREPGGVDRFRRVIRKSAGDALRPDTRTVAVEYLEQENPANRFRRRRRSETVP